MGSDQPLDPAHMLRAARTRAGLSQADLANRAGTSQPAVSRYEHGAVTPSAATFERLLDACTALRPSQILERNRDEVVAAAKKRGATRVLVFGSVARGEDQVGSDVDLLVDLPPGTRAMPDATGVPRSLLLGLLDLQAEIEEILGVPVDLGTIEMLRPQIVPTVNSEARPL